MKVSISPLRLEKMCLRIWKSLLEKFRSSKWHQSVIFGMPDMYTTSEISKDIIVLWCREVTFISTRGDEVNLVDLRVWKISSLRGSSLPLRRQGKQSMLCIFRNLDRLILRDDRGLRKIFQNHTSSERSSDKCDFIAEIQRGKKCI